MVLQAAYMDLLNISTLYYRRMQAKIFLEQDIILENMVLTGLRGVGKTVLLDTFKPLAMRTGWSWVGTDLSESTSVTENTIAIRLLTDLSVVTTSIVIDVHEMKRAGFKAPTEKKEINLSFAVLSGVYENTPGLVEAGFHRPRRAIHRFSDLVVAHVLESP